MKMNKTKSGIVLAAVVLIIAILGYTVGNGWGEQALGAAKNITLGLDLKGGVSITYQVVGDKPSSEDMSDTIYKLQQRVQNYSTESSVYQEGDDRINIEIPGVSDAETILNDLGKPGSLYFIAQHDSEGNENYSYDSSVPGGYKLNKTLEELEADGSIVLTGSEVDDAQAVVRQDEMKNNENVVQLTLDETGTAAFAEATSAAVKSGDTIGIYYDEQFVSVPTVQSAIANGQAVISGNMSAEDAEKLASTIRIGGLTLTLEELRSNVVGAQLGQNAINTSVKAGIIGLLLIFLLMIIVYKLPGFASSLALVIYALLDLFLVYAFHLTLTLPGIAGIILSIGMAVDANVIIFARVKEELAASKSVHLALKQGFQKAMSAIVDGNVTTLIAALVLFLRGSGSVKGFAETLALGIVVSMFTALVITRFIIFALYGAGLKDQKYYGVQKERKVYDFVGKKKIWFAVAGLCILLTFVTMGVNSSRGVGPLNFSLEFKGGTSITMALPEDMTIDELDAVVKPVVEESIHDSAIQIQKVAGNNDVVVKTRTLSLEEREALTDVLVNELSVDKETIQTENISSTISKEMRNDAVVALIMAGILMLVYIWFRFKDIRFATSAVLALAHDVLIVLGSYAILRISVGNTFIACMLTIVGYSINATIVIFDRIRENLSTASSKKHLDELVNNSISYTLTRSIYTTLTTFISVLMLYILGVSSMKDFALPLMVGIIAGCYSSVFLTGVIWYLMRTKIGNKKA